MNSGLLAGTDADGLTVNSVANGVGLGVLQGDQRNDQVDLCAFGQILVGSNDVLQQMCADLEIIAALLKCNAENLLALLYIGDIILVDLDHVISALALGFQNFQSLVGITGGDNAVGNLGLD